MKREDIRKLVGGYAAGILTDEERRELFAAALEDQALFDELMREEPLRELLAEPSSRAELRQAMAEPEPGWSLWWWGVPAAAAVVTMAFAFVLFSPIAQHDTLDLQIAQVREQPRAAQVSTPPASLVAPDAAPARAARAKRAEPGPREKRQEAPPQAAAVEQADQATPGPAAPEVAAVEAFRFTENVRSTTSAQPRALRAPLASPVALQTVAGARAAFYGIPGDAKTTQRFAAAEQPRLGLRYTREGAVLTVEANAAVRLRIFDGDREIFNSTLAPRARQTVAVPEGKPLRAILDRVDGAPSAAARLTEERDPNERATYVVAESEATSMTVYLPQ